MESSDWRNMLIYSITVFSALVLVLGSQPYAEDEPNLKSFNLIDPVNETYFDSENLTVYISGNTSLPNPASQLKMESANYSQEEGLLRVQLGSRDTSKPGTAAPTVIQENVPYTIRANFSEELPESVIVSGVFKEVEAFSPDEGR